MPAQNPYSDFGIPQITSGASVALPQAAASDNPYSQFALPEQFSSVAQQQHTNQQGLFQGATDFPIGAAQLAAHTAALVSPSAVPLEKQIDAYVNRREAAYNPGGNESLDIPRAAGAALATYPFAYLLPGSTAENLGVRALSNAAGGGLSGATARPVANAGPDYWGNVGENAAMGATGGMAGAIPVGAVARTISPAMSTNKDVQTLLNAGIRPTVGQMSGGIANDIEQKLTSIPGVGNAINAGRMRSYEDLNAAAANRALGHIGETLSPGVTGRDAVTEMGSKISGAYNTLLPKLTWKSDPAFVNDVTAARAGMTAPPQEQQQFDTILKDALGPNRVTVSQTQTGPVGVMKGADFKDADTILGQKSSEFINSSDPNQRSLGKALKQAQIALRTALTRSNPQYAGELNNINAAYADAQRVEGAAAMQGATGGVFSPAQLSAAVKSQDQTLRDKAFARGQARMQDLSDAAKKVLGPTVPDSGTAGRGVIPAVLMGLSGGELAHVSPEILAALTGAGLTTAGAYSRPAQSALATLLARRPGFAVPVARGVRALSPLAATFGAQTVSQLGQQQ